jgi:hypothetical protein
VYMNAGGEISIHAWGVLAVLKLTFDKGTIQIQGDVRVPNSTWDERSKQPGPRNDSARTDWCDKA